MRCTDDARASAGIGHYRKPVRLALTLLTAGILFGAYTLYAQGTPSATRATHATHERDKRAAERQTTEKVDKDKAMELLLLEILLIPRNGT